MSRPAGPRVAIALMLAAAAILVGHAGRSVLEAVDRGRSKRSLSAVFQASVALSTWKAERGEFPRAGRERLSAVIAREPSLRVLRPPESDAWGHPLQYMGAGDAYVVWSLGKNGRDDIHVRGGAFEGFDVDLVIRNGVLWQGPGGL